MEGAEKMKITPTELQLLIYEQTLGTAQRNVSEQLAEKSKKAEVGERENHEFEQMISSGEKQRELTEELNRRKDELGQLKETCRQLEEHTRELAEKQRNGSERLQGDSDTCKQLQHSLSEYATNAKNTDALEKECCALDQEYQELQKKLEQKKRGYHDEIELSKLLEQHRKSIDNVKNMIKELENAIQEIWGKVDKVNDKMLLD